MMIISYPDGRMVQDGTPTELALFNFKVAEVNAMNAFKKMLDELNKANESEMEKKWDLAMAFC